MSDQKVLRKLAESGVDTVKISWNADGSARVLIDGYPEISSLPHKLAVLLELLKEDLPLGGTDGLVPFKSTKALVEFMAERTGEAEYRKTALTTSINRLRDAITRAGGNRYLVQTDRNSGGYRFAVRRQATAVAMGAEDERPV